MTKHSANPAQLPETSQTSQWQLWSIAAVWLVLVTLSILLLVNYSNSEVPRAERSAVSPLSPDLPLLNEGRQLLVFMHPKCSCSYATARNLHKLCLSADPPLPLTAVFYCPPDEDFDWVHTELWDLCSKIPNTRCVVDTGGAQAARLGIRASGHVVLVSDDGCLLFDGGILSARGHYGSSAGSLALRKLLNGGVVDRTSFPVFGCLILADGTLAETSRG